MSNSTANFKVYASKGFDLSQKAHFELAVFVDIEKLFEAFFEYWIAEGGRHDVEASSHFNARLHLDHAHLVD